jgi:hypothetical protein
VGCKLFASNVRQHHEHTLEGMSNGNENLGKSADDNLKNVERCKDVCKRFHGLNIFGQN